MPEKRSLPAGVELVRTTDVFDAESVPAGLLRAHQVAPGVWGRLAVYDGSIDFVFEDEPDEAITVAAGGRLVIPPATPHHVALTGPVSFAVEFYRDPEGTRHPAE